MKHNQMHWCPGFGFYNPGKLWWPSIYNASAPADLINWVAGKLYFRWFVVFNIDKLSPLSPIRTIGKPPWRSFISLEIIAGQVDDIDRMFPMERRLCRANYV